MSKTINFEESQIPAEYTLNLLEHYQLTWTNNRTAGIYRVVFTSIALMLKERKAKSTPKIGFILKDAAGKFRFGAIMSYHAPDDGTENTDDDKGNYTLEFTLNEADMKDMDVTIDNHSDMFVMVTEKTAQDVMYGRFKTMEFANNLFIEAIDTLVKYLDANAIEGDEFIVEYRGVFTASVTIENGEKFISIVPGEMVKQIVKGDISL